MMKDMVQVKQQPLEIMNPRSDIPQFSGIFEQIRRGISNLSKQVCLLVVGYGACSSLLAVINKFAITKFDYPTLLTALQYLTSALGVWILGKLGFLQHDPFTWDVAKKFLPLASVFYLAIFANTNLLRKANVDTVIVFRSCTPLLVSIADTTFRKQPWPSKITLFSLLIILGGAIGFFTVDLGSSDGGGLTYSVYSWGFLYLVVITFEMVYIKHSVMNFGLNTWGFVLYNNLLALMIAPLVLIVSGETVDLLNGNGGNRFDCGSFVAVVSSCVFGLLISFFGFAARRAISATAFTVTGVVCKFLTVAINVLSWDKHAGRLGLACLLVTIGAGVLYQQSVTSSGGVSNATSQHENLQLKNAKGDCQTHDLEKGTQSNSGV